MCSYPQGKLKDLFSGIDKFTAYCSVFVKGLCIQLHNIWNHSRINHTYVTQYIYIYIYIYILAYCMAKLSVKNIKLLEDQLLCFMHIPSSKNRVMLKHKVTLL